ncbi:hypothetical protein RRG08_004451 [Elysia crispata]|uniref:Uncharacterized protein n=1 Tax=Elysia crispata TaxID=231223 RepID=A0AAE1AXW6_9GAST|nr:hypothetical protein RRG08_004451 [Elysia crispata]
MTETRRRAQAQSFCSYHLTKVFPPKQVRSLYRLHMKSARHRIKMNDKKISNFLVTIPDHKNSRQDQTRSRLTQNLSR